VIRFIGSRVLSSLATVFGASIVAFVVLRLLPGDPVRLIVGRLASQQAANTMRQVLGLDQPVPVQYAHYLSSFFRGDWGFSYTVGEPVTTLIVSRLPASAELGLAAFLLAFGGAVVLAPLSIRLGWVDAVVRGLSFLGLGVPAFWLALLLLIVFSQQYHLFPGPEGRLSPETSAPPALTGFYTVDALVSGSFATLADTIRHLILPAVCLAFAPFAFLVRLLRSNLREVSREPFMTVVRSKGVSRWATLVRHALPNAFLPTLTAAGLVLAELLVGSVLIETVFDWPGVGALVVQSIERKDYVVVQAVILLSAVAYVVINLVVDVSYGIIDPRVRLGSSLK